MKRPTKGYSGQEVALFPTMLDVTEPSTSPSRITSSPSHSPEPSPSPSPSPAPSPTPEHITAAPTQPSPTQPSPGAEHHLPTPNESPIHAVHSHGSDEEVLLAEVNLSTAGGTTTYSRRSEEQRKRKDKGKAIMTEHWDEEERQRAMSEAKTSRKIDWNDPSVIRESGVPRNYKVLSEMLEDFDRQDNGIAIHMLTEKKYPLSQEMITKMLKKKLEVDHESS
ncbi:hypothetical protein Tco_0909113 [Tanacetum coccineum]|uniref:Uncharacterized protein n=1 Tax=Tanacetum coccineum TaxID=301880 RepID=A0ABQ5CPN4_9ASTR